MSEPQLPKSLLRVLASLTEWFKDQHVSYALIGGAAIGFLGQPRATQDLDAVTWLDLSETPGFVKSGARFGFFPRISDPNRIRPQVAGSPSSTQSNKDPACSRSEFVVANLWHGRDFQQSGNVTDRRTRYADQVANVVTIMTDLDC